jgi:hypothetical protein
MMCRTRGTQICRMTTMHDYHKIEVKKDCKPNMRLFGGLLSIIATAWYTTIPNLCFHTSHCWCPLHRIPTRPLNHLTSHTRDGSHLGQGPNNMPSKLSYLQENLPLDVGIIEPDQYTHRSAERLYSGAQRCHSMTRVVRQVHFEPCFCSWISSTCRVEKLRVSRMRCMEA